MTQIISISIDGETAAYLKRTGLSPSGVFRHAIRRNMMPGFREEGELKTKIELLSGRLDSILRALEKKGWTNDILEEASAISERRLRKADKEDNRLTREDRDNDGENRPNRDDAREIEVPCL